MKRLCSMLALLAALAPLTVHASGPYDVRLPGDGSNGGSDDSRRRLRPRAHARRLGWYRDDRYGTL